MATKTEPTAPVVRHDEQAAQIQKMTASEVIFKMGVRYAQLTHEMQGMERALEVGAYDVFLELSDRVNEHVGRLRAYASELLNRRD